jgi:hypothetical protein
MVSLHPMAALARNLAGNVGSSSLVVALPGNPKAVSEDRGARPDLEPRPGPPRRGHRHFRGARGFGLSAVRASDNNRDDGARSSSRGFSLGAHISHGTRLPPPISRVDSAGRCFASSVTVGRPRS